MTYRYSRFVRWKRRLSVPLIQCVAGEFPDTVPTCTLANSRAIDSISTVTHGPVGDGHLDYTR